MVRAQQIILFAAFLIGCFHASAQSPTNQFVNFETAPVHPLDISPDGKLLAVCNLPDNRVELFDLEQFPPSHLGNVFVGLDPVTVRFRSPIELWVVNHISDSINVIDTALLRVTRVIDVPDGPCDVVFAGTPQKAFISCAPTNTILVLNAETLGTIKQISLEADCPKALAVSKDGQQVFAAIFESGNKTTILAPRFGELNDHTPAGPVDFPSGPHAGLNPPPNSGAKFSPEINPQIPSSNAPPRVSLIVKKFSDGKWKDDNDGDWTEFVSGDKAAFSGRVPGWDLPDHDLAVIDSDSLAVTYIDGLMNVGMGLAVNPSTGSLALVGTDALNHIRYEPVLQSSFVRAHLALIEPTAPATPLITDINHHLDYTRKTLPEVQRINSLSDPRSAVWNSDGTRLFVTGMGSDNLVALDSDGKRVGNAVPLGSGPVGIAVDSPRTRLYVLNRFAATVSILDSSSLEVAHTLAFHDPTPTRVKLGRVHFYNTHKTSGLGLVACASCHVDGRLDRLAWDLGNPTGSMKFLTNGNFANDPPARTNHFHPMKGPMTTQTLQDIIGHEPFHWRGDRDGIEEFNPTFKDLQGRDDELTPEEMQEFEDFLASLHFPPNRFRNFDNSLPSRVSLKGHTSLGRGTLPKGAPLPDGDARAGFTFFRNRLDGGCAVCHTLPSGHGTDKQFVAGSWRPIPLGKNGEHHSAVVQNLRSGELAFKIPHLRNLPDKVGFNLSSPKGTSGFGFTHDGRVDTLARFLQEGFALTNDVQTANVIAFFLAFSGSDLSNPLLDVSNPPGRSSRDAPAAVGRQLLVSATSTLFDQFINRASVSTGRVDLVLKIPAETEIRGFWFNRTNNNFQSDRNSEVLDKSALLTLVNTANPGLALLVPSGTGIRIGIDRDTDGQFDGDERDAGTNPSDPNSRLAPALSLIRISSIREVAGQLELRWNAQPGQQFQLQENSSLQAQNWLPSECEIFIEETSASCRVPLDKLTTAKYFRIQVLE
jgi:YVTN family beta-propeller protein